MRLFLALGVALPLACMSCRDIAGIHGIEITDPGCNGVATDLDTDPDNCGVCGHSCMGAGCSAGLCHAQLLYSVDQGDQIYNLAITDKRVYVLTDYDIESCEPDTCEATLDFPASVVGDRFFINFVVEPSGHIYYSLQAGNSVKAGDASIGGLVSGKPVGLIDGLTYPGDLSVLDGQLFYTDYGPESGTQGIIGGCKLPGCAQPSQYATNLAYPSGSFPLGDDLYYVAVDVAAKKQPYGLFKCSISGGCTDSTDITTPGLLTDFNLSGVVVPTGVVLANVTELVLVTPDGKSTKLSEGRKDAVYLSASGAQIAWADKDARSIWTLDTSSSSPAAKMLWSGPEVPVATTIDAKFVYFATSDGQVQRVAR